MTGASILGGGGGAGSGGLRSDPPGGITTCATAAFAANSAAIVAQTRIDDRFMRNHVVIIRRTASKLCFRRVLDRVEPVSLEAEKIPRLQHMRGQRRSHVYHAAARMRNHDPARQKMQPVLQAARQLPVFLGEIF